MKNSFSKLVSELSEVWWNWMRSDKMARSTELDYKIRREHAEKCESLIKREYQIINQLNRFFENNNE